MIPLIYEVSIVVKFIETENRIEVDGSWEGGGQEGCFMGTEFQFSK